MTPPLDLDEAGLALAKHLGSTPRAAHSRFVGALMAVLARRLDADAALWQLTGLLHDIDYPATAATPERHGPLAAEWLAGRLPAEALTAIAAHDHRAGLTADTPIADALKLADALAILDQTTDRAVTLHALRSTPAALHQAAANRPWLAAMILALPARLHVDLVDLATELEQLPEQAPPPAMTS